ncbi:MAG: T9SS type A sorting domain-containing protein [Bacteroidales bacterium]|nr:T9SS type A sorting domain-containing protein [Bacteroidales bacterium]MCF8350372.1 T9SS type A sorting domain-containing protein [Bacteroidales bacterium]MCF8376255.1 T9SS type A sorting domain-containing protein [Bacteroidales bacterium]MCF8401188.1 T9SS type A sorting domain-containing protein [Bacteroidales bacterium]
MKRMKPKAVILTAVALLISLPLMLSAGGRIELKQNKQTELRILRSDYQVLKLHNNLAAIDYFDVQVDQMDFTQLFIPAYTKNLEIGHPLLPVKRELIEIPAGANPKVLIHSFNKQEVDLAEYDIFNRLFPAQPEHFKDEIPEFIFEQEAYQVNDYGDKSLVTVDDLGYMRATRMGRINIAPLRYNPVQQKLIVYTDIEFSIVFEDADMVQTIENKKRYYSPYYTAINRQLLNYQLPASRENFMRYPVKYVIVSDPMFEAQLQPFVQWKTKKGFTVIEAYTDNPEVGNTKESIKAYLQGLYEEGTTENPAPSFVLFVGDIDQIPAWSGNAGSHVTDLYYCEYTNDYYPEMYYGRFSAENVAQLQPQIDKTLQYEKYEMPDPSYLNEVVMVAGMDSGHGHDWANGQINYGTINYFNEDHGLTSHTYLYPESGSHSDDIIQDISNGVSFGNYTAHCGPSGWSDPSFNTGDIPDLENENEYCLLIGNCCQSNKYDVDACFGEALLRAEDKGALGYIGGSNNTMWDPDYYWGVGVGTISENPPPYEETSLGAYDRLWHDHGEEFSEWYITQDEIIYAGNLAVTEGTPGQAEYYWEIYCLMGDPSLMVYLGEPDPMYADYPEMLPLGTNTLEVETEPYAYISVTIDGVIYGTALADGNGDAVVELDEIEEPCIPDIIITGQNKQPHFGTFIISSPDGPFILYHSYLANDSIGNNDHHFDYGESILLSLTMENFGNGTGYDVETVLSTYNTYITMNDDTENFDSIPGLDTATVIDGYALDIADDVPDNTKVKFNVTSTDGDATWESDFTVTIHAPQLSVGNYTILDTANGGNGNGIFDPGETVVIQVNNKNNGNCAAYSSTATLSSASPYLYFENTEYEIGDIEIMQSEYAEFTVMADSATPEGEVINFDYELLCGGYQKQKDYNIEIGMLYEDWESGNFDKFDWEFSGDEAWLISSQDPYEGSYCAMNGNVGNNETSILEIDIKVKMYDSVSFYVKTSSELSRDMLKFYIDGNEKGSWSGEMDWTYVSIPILGGNHTLKWEYSKDNIISFGSDRVWLDEIIFPPMPVLSAFAGRDDYTCTDSSFQCEGIAQCYQNLEWSTSGDGSFNNPSIIKPVYTPGPEDITNEEAVLSLTAIDGDGSSDSDNMTLSITNKPVAPGMPEGPDYVDVYSQPVSEYSVEEVPFTGSYQWMVEPEEAGTFEGSGSTASISWNEEYTGLALISVRALNKCGTGEISEGLEVTVNNTVEITETVNRRGIRISPNPSTGMFTIFIPGLTKGMVVLEVYDLSGMKVLENEIHGKKKNSIELNCGHLDKGIYFIVIRTLHEKFAEKVVIM